MPPVSSRMPASVRKSFRHAGGSELPQPERGIHNPAMKGVSGLRRALWTLVALDLAGIAALSGSASCSQFENGWRSPQLGCQQYSL